jgi:hypothetical protein
MPRKPNYKFERLERQRQKAAKKAARQEAKQGKTDDRKADGLEPGDEGYVAPEDTTPQEGE